jgi:urocanate hydratase
MGGRWISESVKYRWPRKRTASQEFPILLSLLQRRTGVEPNPITSNGGQRIDHAVKREGTMILHEIEDCDEHVYRLLGEDEQAHITRVPDAGDVIIKDCGPSSTPYLAVSALVGPLKRRCMARVI